MSEAKKILDELFILNEMALHLLPGDTGLKVDLWISERSYAPGRHRPRLKVQWANGEASVSIDDPMEFLAGDIPRGSWKSISKYISVNRDLLLQLWKEEISHADYAKH